MSVAPPGCDPSGPGRHASVRLLPVIRFVPRVAAPLLLMAVWVAVPAAASAHPLGNFTINHYAGIRVAPDGIALDVVIDTAEIPTFQERQRSEERRVGKGWRW